MQKGLIELDAMAKPGDAGLDSAQKELNQILSDKIAKEQKKLEAQMLINSVSKAADFYMMLA